MSALDDSKTFLKGISLGWYKEAVNKIASLDDIVLTITNGAEGELETLSGLIAIEKTARENRDIAINAAGTNAALKIAWDLICTGTSGKSDSKMSWVNPSVANLMRITVSPSETSITVGNTTQYSAMGTYSDNSIVDITATVDWSSSDTQKATVSVGGLALGVAAGTALITATSGLISGSSVLTIGPRPA